jgi:hypothetical protein
MTRSRLGRIASSGVGGIMRFFVPPQNPADAITGRNRRRPLLPPHLGVPGKVTFIVCFLVPVCGSGHPLNAAARAGQVARQISGRGRHYSRRRGCSWVAFAGCLPIAHVFRHLWCDLNCSETE